MKALTIRQPHASLCAHLAKSLETRGYPIRYRGPIAIHAGATVPAAEIVALPMIEEGLKRYGAVPKDMGLEAIPHHLPRGCVLAVADLIDCWEYEDIPAGLLTPMERCFGLYGPGRYAWRLHNVRRLRTPLPYRGAQGLWNFPEQLLTGQHELLSLDYITC